MCHMHDSNLFLNSIVVSSAFTVHCSSVVCCEHTKRLRTFDRDLKQLHSEVMRGCCQQILAANQINITSKLEQIVIFFCA